MIAARANMSTDAENQSVDQNLGPVGPSGFVNPGELRSHGPTEVTVGPTPTAGAAPQAVGTGVAGNIRVNIQNGTPMGGVIITDPPFEVLTGRVALLETLVNELRREINVSAPKEVGIGHNRGPEFAPAPIEDLDDVDELIALLKEQGPNPPTDPTPLVEQSERASLLSAKINQALGVVGSELAKGAAREGGKHLLVPLWTALSHGIDLVIQALRIWLGF
jgi:hypothetical protein